MGNTGQTALFLLAILVFSSMASAADGGVDMQVFCRNFLGIKEVEANNTTVVAEPVVNASNFTYSKAYYSTLAQLNAANDSVERMRLAGFPYLRSRDLYQIALQWFNGQAALELTGEQPDYRFVTEKTSEISSIERDAFAVSDELQALQVRFVNADPAANVTDALAFEKQARTQFQESQFEDARRLISNAYDSITAAEAEATRNKALLESTRRTLEVFLQENWQRIIVVVIGVILIFFIFQKQIRRFMVAARISALAAERGVLEGMIKALQKDYFESGKVNELSYHIKTKKFGDMIRNINRQLPLLKEELKKL